MAKKRLQYAYNAVGNRSLLTDPDGGRFTYAYDSLNRISHLENPQNERATYAYDDNGRRTVKKLANGTRASFSYDGASNLTRLANLKSDGTTISSFDYAYDKTGNRTSVLEADGSRVTWSYDDSYQLNGEHRTGSNAYRNTFTYDAAGNRTLKNESGQRTTYAYDAANQLQTAKAALGTTTYTFDADGNQQIVQPPTGPRTTTTWDYENRTTLVQLAGGLRNTMAYEPDGLRIKLEDSTGTKKFMWDNQNYLAETDENDDTQVVYTNEPQRYGNLISQRRGSTTNWYHFDALGSTRELTLASEAVSDTYLYDVWGMPTASSGATTNPFRFVGTLGYYFDVDSTSAYVRARVYSSERATWNSIDPHQLSTHLPYTYAQNNPSNWLDPSGLLTKSFSRPGDFWNETYNPSTGIYGRGAPDPWYETARITVSADVVSDTCKMCPILTPGALDVIGGYQCSGKVTIRVVYKAVLGTNDPDSVAIGRAGTFGLELQGSGFFRDQWFALDFTPVPNPLNPGPPPGAAGKGSHWDKSIDVTIPCKRNSLTLLATDNAWIGATVDHSIEVSITKHSTSCTPSVTDIDVTGVRDGLQDVIRDLSIPGNDPYEDLPAGAQGASA